MARRQLSSRRRQQIWQVEATARAGGGNNAAGCRQRGRQPADGSERACKLNGEGGRQGMGGRGGGNANECVWRG
eukprot:353169-Chlamydomonas_euryale.AAC.2